MKDKKLVFLSDGDAIIELEKDTSVSCVIAKKDLASTLQKHLGVIVSDDPEQSFYEIHGQLANQGFYGRPVPSKIDPSANIHPTSYVAKESVSIGKKCRIGPMATILENSVLDDDVVIRAGTVVGGDTALSFLKQGMMTPIPSTGGVHIHSHVELHANCCVNRAVFGGYTEIGEYSKFDNLVSVGQNVKIGKRSIFPACAAIADDATIGDDVWIGPNAVIGRGVRIGDRAFVTLGSVVMDDVAPDKKVTGNPAMDHGKFIEFLKKIR